MSRRHSVTKTNKRVLVQIQKKTVYLNTVYTSLETSIPNVSTTVLQMLYTNITMFLAYVFVSYLFIKSCAVNHVVDMNMYFELSINVETLSATQRFQVKINGSRQGPKFGGW